MDELSELLQGAETQIQTRSDENLTPGEAAALAQDAAEADEQQQARSQPTDESLEQLRDLSTLTHAHAALVGMAMSELEQTLLERGATPQQIQQFLDENQAALAEYLWTQHLRQLNGLRTEPLSSLDTYRLALNGGLFFADKFQLEHGEITTPLDATSMDQFLAGELPPGVQARLQEVALSYGYDTPDELFSALFNTENLEQARSEFIRRMEFAAGLSPSTVEALTRQLVEEYQLKHQQNDGIVERFLAELKNPDFLKKFSQLELDQLTQQQREEYFELKGYFERQERGQILSDRESARVTQILSTLAPVLLLYLDSGKELHALQYRGGLQHFLSETSRYGQHEATLQKFSSNPRNQLLIPVQFYAPGAPITALRIRTDQTEIAAAKHLQSPRGNIAWQIALASSFAQEDGFDYDQTYDWLLDQHFQEAGLSRPNGHSILRSQLQSNWASRAQQHAPAMPSGQMAAQIAGGKKNFAALAKNLLKNPAVLAAVAKIGGAGLLGTFAAFTLYKALKPLIDFATGVANFFTGGSSVAAAAPVVTDVAATAASNTQIAATSAAKEVGNTLFVGAKGFGGQVGAGLTAVTTTAATSGGIVAAGIIAPLLSMTLLTIIVWAVIGNSLNDYGGLNVARRRGFGIEGCWPTNGTISTLRTYPNGSEHLVNRDKNGTAIDIAGDITTDIVTPFSGRAIAGYEEKGYGNYVRVKTERGFDLVFAHMGSIDLPDGEQSVIAGQILGKQGKTGNSTGVHLHYELQDIGKQGLEIFDVTPLPESQISVGMQVSILDCIATSQTQATESASTSDAMIAPATSGSSGLDPMSLLEGLDLRINEP